MNRKLENMLARVRPAALPVAICAHRGASVVAPENTLAAFRAAVDAGCEMVELDVFLTRDEGLVVFHDEKTDRTTERRGRLLDLTLSEACALMAGGWFCDRFDAERVPSLEDALATILPGAAPAIEVKQRVSKAPRLVDALVACLERAGAADRAVLIVWDDETAALLRARLPRALVALIAFTRRAIRRAAAGGLDGVIPYYRSTTRRFLAEAAEADLFVAPWTVNRASEIDACVRLGCDAVITDVPEVARDVLERFEMERAQRFLKYVRGAKGQG